MKSYLAVFLGKPEAMDAWKKMPEADRKQREQDGISAWHKWVADHKDAIAEMGSPLGKTKRTDKNGVTDTRNELGAWTVVKANSQDEAARLFLNHPHFTFFPGDRVEVMECLPIPGAQ
ncbi:MAG TPA: hypothetical protein VHC71_15880 [Hyphomicrobium sp.]|jgi:hypothetical protein|nr:hypothetical protein [Hyphomicrobium sp.]